MDTVHYRGEIDASSLSDEIPLIILSPKKWEDDVALNKCLAKN